MESFAGMKKKRTFATLLNRRERALSSAGSERLPYKQRVGGSNPSAPTDHKGILTNRQDARFLCLNLAKAGRSVSHYEDNPFSSLKGLYRFARRPINGKPDKAGCKVRNAHVGPRDRVFALD